MVSTGAAGSFRRAIWVQHAVAYRDDLVEAVVLCLCICGHNNQTTVIVELCLVLQKLITEEFRARECLVYFRSKEVRRKYHPSD
jgi:hypothetical protein